MTTNKTAIDNLKAWDLCLSDFDVRVKAAILELAEKVESLQSVQSLNETMDSKLFNKIENLGENIEILLAFKNFHSDDDSLLCMNCEKKECICQRLSDRAALGTEQPEIMKHLEKTGNMAAERANEYAGVIQELSENLRFANDKIKRAVERLTFLIHNDRNISVNAAEQVRWALNCLTAKNESEWIFENCDISLLSEAWIISSKNKKRARK